MDGSNSELKNNSSQRREHGHDRSHNASER